MIHPPEDCPVCRKREAGGDGFLAALGFVFAVTALFALVATIASFAG